MLPHDVLQLEVVGAQQRVASGQQQAVDDAPLVHAVVLCQQDQHVVRVAGHARGQPLAAGGGVAGFAGGIRGGAHARAPRLGATSGNRPRRFISAANCG